MKTCPVCATPYPDAHNTCPTDGAVLIETLEFAAGEIVRGKYKIIRKLGQGGMGSVYLAEHLHLGEVALKFLNVELSKNPQFVKRFRNEARAAYDLRHANIVDVKDLDQDERGNLFIAMEYVPGPTLRAELRKTEGLMSVVRVLQIARGIAAGLRAAHARRVVHRDIKPENILLRNEANGETQPKIADFGIVAMIDGTSLLTSGGLFLTPEYAAPEQWTGEPASELDGRTDLYALGGIIYEMLAGRRAFQGEREPSSAPGWMYQHLQCAPDPLSELRPDIETEYHGLTNVVMRLLAKDRNERFETALALLDALASVHPQADLSSDSANGLEQQPAVVTSSNDAEPNPIDAAVPSRIVVSSPIRIGAPPESGPKSNPGSTSPGMLSQSAAKALARDRENRIRWKRRWMIGGGAALILTILLFWMIIVKFGSWSHARRSGTTNNLDSIFGTADGSHLWTVGEKGTILESDDGGISWQPRTSWTLNWLHSIFGTADGRHLWVVGALGTILESDDGGVSWQVRTSGTTSWLRSIFGSADGRHLWTVGDEGTILESDDGGASWQVQKSGLESKRDSGLHSIFGTADGRHLWTVGWFRDLEDSDNDTARGTILESDDGGSSWQPRDGGRSHLDSIFGTADGRHLWAVGREGAIRISNDGGISWEVRDSEVSDTLIFIFGTANGRYLCAGSADGPIIESDDGGASWRPRRRRTSAMIHSIFASADGRHLWTVGSKGTILESDPLLP